MLSTISDAAGRTTQLTIDDDGNLREVVLADGEATRYGYENFRMVSATHPNGGTSLYSYRDDGTLQSAQRPGGAATQIQPALSQGPKYAADGRLFYQSTLTDSRGVQHTLEVDQRGAIVTDAYVANGVAYSVRNVLAPDLFDAATNQRTPNRLLRVGSTTVNGLTVSPVTTFDTLGRAIQLNTTQGDTILSKTIGLDGRLAKIDFAETGLDWRFAYDAAGHLTDQFDQPFNGSPTGRRFTLADFRAIDGQPTRVTEHGVTANLTFNDRGLLQSSVDTVGRSSTIDYDSAGNPAVVSDGTTSVSYLYDAGNRLTSITDAEGHVTTLGYQDQGCSCSQDNQLTSLVTPDLPQGKQWAFTYDADGRRTSTTTPLGDTERLDWTPQGDLSAVHDLNRRTTTFAHDDLGRVTTVDDPATRRGTFAYSVPTSSAWSGPTLYAQSSNATAAPTSLTATLADGQYQVGVNLLPSGGRSDYVELYRDATFELALGRHFDKLGRPDVRNDRTDKSIDSVVPPNSSVTPFVFEDYAYDNFSSPAPLFSGLASNNGGMLVDRNVDFDITAAPRLLGDTKVNGLTFGRDAAGRITSSFASFRIGLVDDLGHPVQSR